MTFILSFDCEGKWGVADHLTSEHHHTLSDARLRKTYRGIVSLLDEFDIPATMAFAGCWSLDRNSLEGVIDDYAALVPWYVAPAADDFRNGSREGWVGDWAVDLVKSARTRHEVALHGVTHVPWDQRVSVEIAKKELAMFPGPILRNAKTFVYPRNVVGHTAVLSEFGIVGYRGAPPRRSRLMSLLSEFNVMEKPEPFTRPGSPTHIPAGFFLNWRHGLRKLVPMWVTVKRAKLLLERAASSGGVVHYWTHPENMASAPQTLELLRSLLQEVAKLRDKGRIRVMTQEEYCAAVKATQ